jgi:hypothetical protein
MGVFFSCYFLLCFDLAREGDGPFSLSLSRLRRFRLLPSTAAPNNPLKTPTAKEEPERKEKEKKERTQNSPWKLAAIIPAP